MTERARAGLGAGAKQEHGESGKHERRKNTRQGNDYEREQEQEQDGARPAFGPERLRAAFAIWGNHLRRLSGERNLTRARLRLRWSITSNRSAMGGSVGFLLS